MKFLKEHLKGKYDWKFETERSVFDGNATRRLFNRWNGNQVLFVINIFMTESEFNAVECGKKAEQLITDRLPFDTRSEMSVVQWLHMEYASFIV